MLNSDPPVDDTVTSNEAAVNAILRSSPTGAIVLAGIGTAIIVAIWFAFYFLIFVPRTGVSRLRPFPRLYPHPLRIAPSAPNTVGRLSRSPS